MERIYNFCFKFLKYCVAIALVIVIVNSCCYLYMASDVFWHNSLAILLSGGFLLCAMVMLAKISNKNKLLLILIIAFVVRLIWALNSGTVLVSDYRTIYNGAEELLAGKTSSFKGYGYMSRFPHLVPMSLYMLGMMILFPVKHLAVMKGVSIVLSVLTVYLMYVLSKYFVKKEELRLLTASVSTIFPSFVCFSSTFCTETIAMPLFLISIILFFKAHNSEKNKLLFLASGILFYLSNLFRAVGIVFLIACVIYILLCGKKNKFLSIGLIVAGYAATALIISGILMCTGIIDKPLWRGSEPSYATLMLKGSNFEHHGMWNVDDARFIEENLKNEDLTKLCFEKIGERLSSKSLIEVIAFYISKFASQWSYGDCCGAYWATINTSLPIAYPLPEISQIIYLAIITLSLFSAFSSKENKPQLYLCLLLCGFGVLFMLLETQGRYSYIVSWTFILLCVIGIENLISERVVKKQVITNTYKKYKTQIMYMIFGAVTTVVNVVAYHLLCNILSVPNVAGTIIAWFVSVIVAYITNKIWVFESKSLEISVLTKEMSTFFSCRFATGILDVVIMWIGVNLLLLPSVPIKILSNIIVIILNYILSKIFIFK